MFGPECKGAMTEILAALDELVAQLSRPLAPADRDEGWDDEIRDGMREHLGMLRARLADGRPPAEAEQYHLVRWLGYDGIIRGPLVSRFAELQQRLWDLFGENEA
jgi:hypothetical protein